MRLSRLRQILRRFYRHRSIRLTPEGTRFILFTLAVGVAAINTGNNLLYLLLAMMLSLIVMSGILSEQSLKGLDIQRRLPDHLYANRPGHGVFTITNRKARLPTFSLRLMDTVGNTSVDRGIHLLYLRPRGAAWHRFPLQVSRRGLYRVEEVRLLTRFPFGLFAKVATIPLLSETVVYPEVIPLPRQVQGELAAMGSEWQRRRRGQGSTLYNLRGYHAGDDSRAIHWKTSARQGVLMVREVEAEEDRRMTVLLPLQAPEGFAETPEGSSEPERQFERAVSLTASVLTHFQQRGYAVRLRLGDEDLGYGVDAAHVHRLLHALALCRPEREVGPENRMDDGGRRIEVDRAGEPVIMVWPWDEPARPSLGGGTIVLRARDFA